MANCIKSIDEKLASDSDLNLAVGILIRGLCDPSYKTALYDWDRARRENQKRCDLTSDVPTTSGDTSQS